MFDEPIRLAVGGKVAGELSIAAGENRRLTTESFAKVRMRTHNMQNI